MLLIAFFALSNVATLFAQTPINLQAAIDSAKQNNQQIQYEKLNTLYYKEKIKTAIDIPKTALSFDYGQINSVYLDNKISISQSLKFPTVYAQQKNIAKAEWENSLTNVAVKEKDIANQVGVIYTELAYLLAKENTLKELEEIYTTFNENAQQRFKYGETNVIEKKAAASARLTIKLQLNDINLQKKNYQELFKLFLNAEKEYIPSEKKIVFSDLAQDTSKISAQPYLKSIEQQQKIIAEKIE